jgi:transcriptional regulator with GAF, ATPase, and Fis domain
MITDGGFREDLWFRLSGFPIPVPPVRQRKSDIPALTRHFVMVKSRELGIAVPPSIAPGALLRLMEYDWPGNVRELENMVERELIRHRGGPLAFETMLPREEERTKAVSTGVAHPHLPLKLDEAMAAHISEVLKVAQGKIHGTGGAAELLGVNPTTLRTRMDQLGIRYRRRDRGTS